MLTYNELGNKNHQTMLFVHGWPDSGDLWMKQMAQLSSEYHCVSVTLPNFQNPIEKESKWGYDFDQLTDFLAATIQEQLKTSSFKDIILVGHDWGAYLCYLLERKHPELIRAFITLDVGGHMKPNSVMHALFILGYQWWLILAFFIGMIFPPLGNEMTRWISQIAEAPRGRSVRSTMNYPYFYFWRSVFLENSQSINLKFYKPTKPLLYLYGAKKKYHFHSSRWINIVENNKRNKVVALPTFHWISMEEPVTTVQVMRQWLLTL